MRFLILPFLAYVSITMSMTRHAAAERPNILLLAIDDLNDWVGCLGGHPQAHSPNIDRLAEKGVLFTNAHCQGPICNPSRTSFMLGLRPSTTGIYYNSPWFRSTEANKNRVSLTQHFASQGYRTFTTGKIYHGSRVDPASFQVLGPRPGQKNPRDRQIRDDLPKGVAGLWDFGPQAYAEREFNDFVDASWAIKQLKAQHDKPFFLTVGLYRPHVPFYAPARVFEQIPQDSLDLPKVKDDDWDDLPASAKQLTQISSPPPHEWFVEHNAWKDAVQAYLAAVRFTDEQIGRVLDALNQSRYADNTIVVLLSDHGFHLGEKQRWAKVSLWERSTRVPFIIALPGRRRGVRCSRPVELMSVFPTLISLCDVQKRDDLDGVSLTPLLEDPNAAWDRPAVTTLGQNNHAVRSDRWRYIRYADGSEELYDHEKDPDEWYNLAGDSAHADVIREHEKWLPKTNVPAARSPMRSKKPGRAAHRPHADRNGAEANNKS